MLNLDQKQRSLFRAHASKLLRLAQAGERITPEGLDWARNVLARITVATSEPQCIRCGRKGHTSNQCKWPTKAEGTSFSDTNAREEVA